MNPEQFYLALKEKNIILSDKQQSQFHTYFAKLVEWNEKINLTSLTEETDVYLKHFYDSITAAFYYDFTKDLEICDVGAGAGFPSIPLKICFPHLKVTIVDSLNKRLKFLETLAKDLELDEHIAFHHSRAEIFGQNKEFREKFDLVTARAVARLSVLSELCLPLCKTGGVFIAMKGAQAEEELKESTKAIQILGGDKSVVHTFHLPTEAGDRSIIVINKKKKTLKKYPRKPGTPNKTPIK